MSEKVVKVSKMSNKPLSLEPYLEVLREKITGSKNSSIRKYVKAKLKRLMATKENVKKP
jgi:hypothetical protein